MAVRLDVLALVVEDIRRSVRFYQQLGLPIPDPPEGESHYEFVLPNGLRLAWDTVELMKCIVPTWEDPVGHRMGIAFLCEDPKEVDRIYSVIISAGYASSLEPWDAFWGQRYAQVVDPDKNLVDLFAPLQTSQ